MVKRVAVRSCVRRGPAVDLVLDRTRENRSQFVFTARAAGVAGLVVVVDEREHYPFRFAHQQVATLPWAAPAGDYAVMATTRCWPRSSGALAETQVRWPGVPIFFATTRPLAEEWTYRFLGAA